MIETYNKKCCKLITQWMMAGAAAITILINCILILPLTGLADGKQINNKCKPNSNVQRVVSV